MTPEPGFFRAVVGHPVAVTMVFLAALVFGLVSYWRLPVELVPDITYPAITVRTVFEGAAPQEVESLVSRPVEEALATLDGLVGVESRSRAGVSDVVLSFDWGTDMSASTQTIRENLQTTWLPPEVERPLVLRYDPSLDPFLRVALAVDASSKLDERRALFLLREIAEREIQRDLEGMEGVAAVRVRGGLEREIRVAVREDWMAARQVTLGAVTDALRAENVNIAGGSILQGDVEYLVRTLNQFRTVDEIRGVRIRRGDGVLVPLSDVAVVEETNKDRQVVSHLDGREAVELEIFKEADANVVAVAASAKQRLAQLEEKLPDGVTLRVLDDQAAFIEQALSNLRGTAVLGGFIAVFVLFLFLRDFRATAVIGAAIPVSVIAGFGPLQLQGVTLNLMSLGGLALGVGMLVDNAVVVLESVQRWREEGLPRAEAAVRGAQDVAAAVVASTLTTIAVFLPITFVEGVAGELFGDLALAVVWSLLASLVVALLLVPMLAALEPPALRAGGGGLLAPVEAFFRDRRPWPLVRGVLGAATAGPRAGAREALAWMRGRWWRWAVLPWFALRFALHFPVALLSGLLVVGLALLARVGLVLGRLAIWPVAALLWAIAGLFERVYAPLARGYDGVLGGALRRPGLVLAGALLVFLAAVGMLRGSGTELLPELAQGRFTIEAALPVGTPLARTRQVMELAEERLAEHRSVAMVYATIGADARADTRSDEGEHTARLRVELVPGADEARVVEELRGAMTALPGVEAKFVPPALFSFRTPVELVLFGDDLDKMRDVGAAVVGRLRGVPGLRDVRSSLVAGNPEIRILYDRDRLRRFGLDPATVATRVREKVQGLEATRVQRGEERVDVRVQLVEGDRSTLADLRALNVNPAVMPPIPLAAVANFEEAEGPSEIRRVDQQRAVVVSAAVAGLDLGSSAAQLEGAMRGVALPPEVRWEVGGQAREMEGSLASMRFALLLAVFLVYVIMASTFESVVQPLVILFAVPLAVIGVALALWVTGTPISVVVLIGAVVLAGVVVNNAIVLVDTVNRLRAGGRSRLDAVREAGALRLRPILITTATTVLGLLPLSFGFGAGAEIQQPLAVTVIGGLTSSTLLTLLVIPVLLGARGAVHRGEGATAEVAA